jgi:hypothetical protein
MARMATYIRILVLLLVLVGSGAHPITAGAQEWSGLRERSKNSVLFIRVVTRNLDGSDERVAATASGFVVSRHGHLLTSAHVVPRDEVKVQAKIYASSSPRDNRRLEMTVVKVDRDLDAALLQLPPSQDWSALHIAGSSTVPDDARLLVLGFPKGLELSSAEGLLSNRFAPGGRFQTTLPLNYGNSGGPVFDIGGRVVGMSAGGFDEAQLITFVTPSDFFKPLLALAGLSDVPGSAVRPPPTSLGPGRSAGYPFSFTVDHQDRREFSQVFCVAEGERIKQVSLMINSQNGNGTHVVSSLPMTDRPNCVTLLVVVAGNGVDRLAGVIVNHRGRGWLSGNVNVVY